MNPFFRGWWKVYLYLGVIFLLLGFCGPVIDNYGFPQYQNLVDQIVASLLPTEKPVEKTDIPVFSRTDTPVILFAYYPADDFLYRLQVKQFQLALKTNLKSLPVISLQLLKQKGKVTDILSPYRNCVLFSLTPESGPLAVDYSKQTDSDNPEKVKISLYIKLPVRCSNYLVSDLTQILINEEAEFYFHKYISGGVQLSEMNWKSPKIRTGTGSLNSVIPVLDHYLNNPGKTGL